MADAYIRATRAGNLLFGPPIGFDSLAFIDVDPEGGDIRSLREAPHTFLSGVRWLIVRDAHADARADLEQLSKRLQLRAHAGILVQRVGEAPTVSWIGDSPDGAEGLELRARRVELRALLRWRGAVWQGIGHHYLLPSGQHASAFVKIGQIFAEPRDADVIATWLLDRFDDARSTALVLDSGTLTPVALALRSILGDRLGRVAILNQYPSTDVAVDRAIEAAAITNRVVGVVSVCASGRLRDRMRNAFSWRQEGLAWSIDSIVDLAEDWNRDGQDRSWVTVQHDDGTPIRSYSRDCGLCRTFDRSLVIPVDPATFDAYLPTMRERHMLDIVDAGRNRELWNACHRSECIQLEASPDEHVRPFRPTREVLPIKLDVGRLLDDDEFRDVMGRRLSRLFDQQPALRNIDLVLTSVPTPPGTGRALESLALALERRPKLVEFPMGEWSEEVIENIRAATNILALSPGTVTGYSLQRALMGVQEVRRGTSAEYRIAGLTLHARPGRKRDWETLTNSYAGALHALFLSYLPRFAIPSSPIQDEAALLEQINPESLSREALAFWEIRREFCGGRESASVPLFWGQAFGQQLSAHSIFGDGLDAVTTYTAVASALHSQRQKEIRRPQRLAFELPAVFRSYYDPLIVAAVLRWIRPTEAWWGEQPESAEIVISEVLSRAKGLPQIEAMIVAELILAAALGKVPLRATFEVLLPEAQRLRDLVAPDVLEVAISLMAARGNSPAA